MGVAHAVAPQTMQELDSNVVLVRIDDDTIKLAGNVLLLCWYISVFVLEEQNWNKKKTTIVDGRDAASSMPQLPFVNILTKHVDRHFKVHPT